MNEGPVFIAGLERTGTSLIHALLGSHPDIAMTRRTNFWRYVYGQYGDLSDRTNLDNCLAVLRRYKRLVVLDLDFDALRESFVDGPATYERLFELIGQQVAARQGKPRWGDKSLLTERFATLIFNAYPGARIIHMVRDPRDRFASSQARWGGRLGGVGGGAAEWVTSAKLALHNRLAFPHSYRIVRYEQLTSDPVGTLAEICDFIGALYTPQMLEMSQADSFREAGGNSSYGSRAPGVISTSSIGKYRAVLSEAQIDFMNLAAGRLMRQMGYAPDSISQLRGALLRRAGHPVELFRFYAWNAREAFRRKRVGKGVPERRIVEVGTT